jgi:hypothetical protein
MKKFLLIALIFLCVFSVFAGGRKEAASEKIIMKVGTIENINNLGAKAVDSSLR